MFFIDHISYAMECNKHQKKKYLDIRNLPINKRLKIAFYESDHMGYFATTYDFIIHHDKTYSILETRHYSNLKTNGKQRVTNMNLKDFITYHKKKLYMICISYPNEHQCYPFSNLNTRTGIVRHRHSAKTIEILKPAQRITIKLYTIPVKNFETKINLRNKLKAILSYYGYKELSTKNYYNNSNVATDTQKSIEEVLTFINK